jgi:hypothetical protein
MTRILAHQRDLGNGVGLHYSGFRRFSAFPASPNQLPAPTQPRENRRHRPPIREVGLAAAAAEGVCAAAGNRRPETVGAGEIRTGTADDAGRRSCRGRPDSATDRA